jgi:tight adherence protein C
MGLMLGLACVGSALALAIYLIVAKRPVPAAAEITEDLLYGPPVPAAERKGRKTRDPNNPDELLSIFKRAQGVAARLTPSDYTERLHTRLDRAGNPASMPPERVMAYKGLGLVAGILIGFLFAASSPGIGLLLWPAILGAAGFFLPDLLVNNLGTKRKQALLNGLPDALDTLTVCVEAGLAFDGALSRVARNMEGPMAEECARMLQEMQFGLSRSDALRALANRSDLAEIRSFVSAMVQAGDLGISIGTVLREQSREMRVRRRQRAEEKAQKLTVKILFPLIFCMMPAMFVVLLGPAIMNIMKFFGSAH